MLYELLISPDPQTAVSNAKAGPTEEMCSMYRYHHTRPWVPVIQFCWDLTTDVHSDFK